MAHEGTLPEETRGAAKVRVLVVDDSAVMRRAITRILEAEGDIEVVATAKDGAEAIELAAKLRPDVITMDVNMPRVDGLRAVEVIMGRHPIPIVLLSAYARPGGEVARQALAYGAVHIIAKPSEHGVSLDLERQAEEIRAKVRGAARVRVIRNAAFGVQPTPKPVVPRPEPVVRDRSAIVAIGASTGGTVVLGEILPILPADFAAPVLVVQHMPPGYTGEWARSLNEQCALSVVEARHGDSLRPGVVYIAPGGHHMEVRGHYVRLSAGPRVKSHRPSVDVLFDSLLPVAPCVHAVLLTGMGDDGVAGLVRLHAAGAETIVQDQNTSVVWGMPGAAVRTGSVMRQLPPLEVARHLVRSVGVGPPVAESSQSLVASGAGVQSVHAGARNRAEVR
jgi:two-component system chemotaxis response regulator CheB